MFDLQGIIYYEENSLFGPLLSGTGPSGQAKSHTSTVTRQELRVLGSYASTLLSRPDTK